MANTIEVEVPVNANVHTTVKKTVAEVVAEVELSAVETEYLNGAVPGTVAASKCVVANADANVGVVKATALHIGTSGSETQVTATAAQLNRTAVTTPGTQEASKAVIADANTNIGVVKATALHIGATGAETQVTATAAELNLVDGSVVSNDVASKAAMLDADKKIRTAAGVGAKNGASVAVVEYGVGDVIHKTVLTCTATPVTFGDEAAQGQYGGVKVYDFPVGLICTLGATVDGALTLTAPAIDAWDGDIGLGLEAPTDHQDVANKTGQIMPKVSTTQAVAKVATVDAVSVATALTESGARWLDGTGTAKDLFLNFLVDDNGAHDNTITGAFTGTITVVWMNLGTTA